MDAKTTGDYGEMLVAMHYKKNGYIIAATNYRTRLGEIDIIVEKCGIMAYVEVKTRKAGGIVRPSEYVNSHKQKRLVLAAMDYASTHKLGDVAMRFDVAEVEIAKGCPPVVNIIENAFDVT